MNFEDIPLGKPELFNVLVEIPAGSVNKYEMDATTGHIFLDYVFKDGFSFPFNYAFVPHTMAEDGDPLDVMVLSSAPIHPNTVVQVKPLGILKLKDRGEQDNKLVGVAAVDPMADGLNDISDLGEEWTTKTRAFWEQVAVQKNKVMEIDKFYGKDEAIAEVKRCMTDK